MLINTRRRSFAILFAGMMIVGAAASQLSAQTITGRLLDQYTNKPIPNATITLVNEQGAPVGPTARTGNDGRFSIAAPAPGIYRLRANVSGYITAVSPAVALQPGDRIDLNWRLLAGAISLRPVAIVGNARPNSGVLSGFQQRAQRRAFGYFITRDQIEKTRPFSVSDLLRTIPGLEVVPSLRGFGNVVRTIEGCTPAVYLDGVRFPLMGESIDDIVNPNELEGIEVYTHAAEVPPEFAGGWSNCGVIALWTRRG